jgi:hypothetical protein
MTWKKKGIQDSVFYFIRRISMCNQKCLLGVTHVNKQKEIISSTFFKHVSKSPILTATYSSKSCELQLMADLKSNEYCVAGLHTECVVINGMGQINYGLCTSVCK